MFLKFFRRRAVHVNQVFNAQYIDPKGLFVQRFDEIPSAAYITDININEAYPFLRKLLQSRLASAYQHAHFNHEQKKLEFNVTFLVLDNEVLVEIGGDFVGFYYAECQFDFVANLVGKLSDYRIVKEGSTKIGFATQQEAHQN